VPALGGRFIPILRVSDVTASAEWYLRVFCLVEVSRYSDGMGSVRQVVLSEPQSGLILGLVSTDTACAASPFDEQLVGLDHLEFLIPNFGELTHWVNHLDVQGVPHSGIKIPEYSRAAMVTFRDEDNIQLELFCPEP